MRAGNLVHVPRAQLVRCWVMLDQKGAWVPIHIAQDFFNIGVTDVLAHLASNDEVAHGQVIARAVPLEERDFAGLGVLCFIALNVESHDSVEACRMLVGDRLESSRQQLDPIRDRGIDECVVDLGAGDARALLARPGEKAPRAEADLEERPHP